MEQGDDGYQATRWSYSKSGSGWALLEETVFIYSFAALSRRTARLFDEAPHGASEAEAWQRRLVGTPADRDPGTATSLPLA